MCCIGGNPFVGCPVEQDATVAPSRKSVCILQITASLAAAEHRQMAVNSVGVDAPQDTDLFYRFAVSTCFFVGGLGSTHKVCHMSITSFNALRMPSCQPLCSIKT